jgi:hypothetical protein
VNAILNIITDESFKKKASSQSKSFKKNFTGKIITDESTMKQMHDK